MMIFISLHINYLCYKKNTIFFNPHLSQWRKKSMKTKTILIYNFKRALSLALSFFLIFSPMYAYSQTEETETETETQTEIDRNSIQLEDIFFKEGRRTSRQNRAMNALREKGITTVDQLINMTEVQILKISGIGKLSFRALIEEMESKGLSSTSLTPSNRIKNILFTEGRRTHVQTRIMTALEGEGITTMDRLTSMTEVQILKIPRIGKLSLRTLRAEMESKGYSFVLLYSSTELEGILFTEGRRTAFQENILGALRGKGITTVDQLINMTEVQILKITGIGKLSLRTLRAEIEAIKEQKSKCNNSFESIRRN